MNIRRPSQRSIDLYNALVEKQNEVRKKLQHIHKRAEESVGAGRLPALVIPKQGRKISMSQFRGADKAIMRAKIKAFWNSYRDMKVLFGQGIRSYLARTVKDGYMELWREQIKRFTDEDPDLTSLKMFSREQIENSQFGEFMSTYNRLMRLSPESFLAMLYSGRIIEFKWIYDELSGKTGKDGNSWLEQQNYLLSIGAKGQVYTMEEMVNYETHYGKGGHWHKKDTMKEAEKLKAETESKNASRGR